MADEPGPPPSFLGLLRASALVVATTAAFALLAWLGWRWFEGWVAR